MNQEILIFSIIIDSEEIIVRYQPNYFVSAQYAHFEFASPHSPPRRTPFSETGYYSHFSPRHEVEASASPVEYATTLANALAGISGLKNERPDMQMCLF
jgi:hypothetical protein